MNQPPPKPQLTWMRHRGMTGGNEHVVWCSSGIHFISESGARYGPVLYLCGKNLLTDGEPHLVGRYSPHRGTIVFSGCGQYANRLRDTLAAAFYHNAAGREQFGSARLLIDRQLVGTILDLVNELRDQLGE